MNNESEPAPFWEWVLDMGVGKLITAAVRYRRAIRFHVAWNVGWFALLWATLGIEVAVVFGVLNNWVIGAIVWTWYLALRKRYEKELHQ